GSHPRQGSGAGRSPPPAGQEGPKCRFRGYHGNRYLSATRRSRRAGTTFETGAETPFGLEEGDTDGDDVRATRGARRLTRGRLGLAFQMRHEPRVAMTFFGEGSTANGVWHEAMNVAGVRRLPVVFVLENNQFAYSTPNSAEFAVDPLERAATYGFPGVKVDG